MSPLAAPLVTFLFFSSFAAAQIFAPDCSLTWEWSFNSIDQNACTVAAYLMSTCNGGTFTINALKPGYSYTGPSGIDDTNLCKCNTVTYSLISACDACQGAVWTSWSEYSANCTKTLPPSTFPYAVPSGTRVPQWALIDITSGNNWDANKSYAVGDSPEIAPGAILGASGASGAAGATVPASGTRSGATSSFFNEPSSNAKPTSSSKSKSSSNLAPIIGGVVGGVAVIALVVTTIAFIMQRGRSEASAPVAPPFVGAYQPPMDEIQQPLTVGDGYAASTIPGTIGSSTSIPGTPVSPMRIYDPNDPSTYPGYQGSGYQEPGYQGSGYQGPGYQGVPQTPATPHQGSTPSINGAGNSLATMQTSRPQGYHGLPTV